MVGITVKTLVPYCHVQGGVFGPVCPVKYTKALCTVFYKSKEIEELLTRCAALIWKESQVHIIVTPNNFVPQKSIH